MANIQPEVWQRGPIDGVPALLQPVAHTLLQAGEEIKTLVPDIPLDKLWFKPFNIASAGFHLQHITGVADRLFTYAKNEQLTEKQLAYLSAEGKVNNELNAADLAEAFYNKLIQCIDELKMVNVSTLTETRYVGRKKIPTTTIGLYVHTAEHIMRHVGQLLVTTSILKNK